MSRRKLIYIIFIMTLALINMNGWSETVTTVKEKSKFDESIFYQPYLEAAFGIRSGYTIFQDTSKHYLSNTVPMNAFFLFNPRIIDNFLTEIEFGYMKTKLKFDPDGSYQQFDGILSLIYQYPFTSYVCAYGIAGGGINYNMVKSNYGPEGKRTSLENIIKLGFGSRLELDYSYIIDIRGAYNHTINKNNKHTGIEISLGIGYALGGDPGVKIGKYIPIKYDIKEIFPAQSSNYGEIGITKISVTNNLKRKITSLKITLENTEYFKNVGATPEIRDIQPGANIEIPLKLFLNEKTFTLSESKNEIFDLVLKYKVDGVEDDLKVVTNLPVMIHKGHGITWEDTRKVGSFITSSDNVIEKFIRDALINVKAIEKSKKYSIPVKNLVKAVQAYSALSSYGLKYVSDPNGIKTAIGNKAIIDTIQYPREFMVSKTGDCDDFTVLFCALLENIGVPTAIITIPGHIFMAFDTGLPYDVFSKAFGTEKIKGDKDHEKGTSLYIKHGDNAWIPIEVTMLSNKEPFLDAWKVAIENYNSNSNREFIQTADCVSKYLPYVLPASKIYFKQSTNLANNYKDNISAIRDWVKPLIKKDENTKKLWKMK